MKYLITVSLLNSFSFFMSEYGDREDFIRMLNKEFHSNEYIERGIKFEDDILEYNKSGILPEFNQEIKLTETRLNNHNLMCDCIREFGDEVKGGFWQKSFSKTIKIGDDNFVIYGRADVVKEDTIYDIKYTKKYDLGKYKDSMQHRIELACSDFPTFKYIVSDLKDTYVEEYQKSDDDLDIVREKIIALIRYLEADKEAMELFKAKWKSKY